jgi:hypothetical protein
MPRLFLLSVKWTYLRILRHACDLTCYHSHPKLKTILAVHVSSVRCGPKQYAPSLGALEVGNKYIKCIFNPTLMHCHGLSGCGAPIQRRDAQPGHAVADRPRVGDPPFAVPLWPDAPMESCPGGETHCRWHTDSTRPCQLLWSTYSAESAGWVLGDWRVRGKVPLHTGDACLMKCCVCFVLC